MALSPSRRDTIGPPPRDVSDLAAIVRHHGSYLRQLDPGLLNGRFGSPRPWIKGSSQIVGGDGGGDAADDEEIQFWNTDATTAGSAGTITLSLTYEPIEGSLHIRWNGLDQPPTAWTLDGQSVTFTNAHVHAGDALTAAYAYYLDEEPLSLVVRGTTRNTGKLPVETVAGDFIVVAARWGFGASIDFSVDPRLTQISSDPSGRGGVWAGIASNLAQLQYTGTVTKCVVVAYVGGATVQAVTAAVGTSSAVVGPMSGGAAIVVAGQRSSVVPGGLAGIPAPWVLDENSGDAEFVSVRVYHWLDYDATTTPTATAAAGTGGIDQVDAVMFTVVGLG